MFSPEEEDELANEETKTPWHSVQRGDDCGAFFI
jgi:hypothetical protein